MVGRSSQDLHIKKDLKSDLHLKSFSDLPKIFIEDHLVQIFGRSLIKILLRSSKDRGRDKLFKRFDGESYVRSHEI